MKKRDFLKLAGLASAGALVTTKSVGFSGKSGLIKGNGSGGCALIPTETAGPFPLDLTENTTFFRQDVTEDREGVPFTVKLRIMGLENCLPMPNVRVNIWHCDKDGLYSGYSQQNNQGQAGLTYLRGYQFTDAYGEVEFTTIFPGWYNGRICHIHFQVYVSSSYSAISQLTFDPDTKNAIYQSNSSLYSNGVDPMTLDEDMIFEDGYETQMATLVEDGDGYYSELEVSVQGEGVLGIGLAEKLTAEQITAGQNYPNPYTDQTTIPFELKHPGIVQIEVWNISGKRVKTISLGNLPQGSHVHQIDLKTENLNASAYVYQVSVKNDKGSFRVCKVMTRAR